MPEMMELLRQAGFQPALNQDDDFPVLSGEYAASIKTLRPYQDKDSGEKTAYMAQFKIGQTLSGDLGDNRLLTKWYRIGGTDYQGAPLTDEAKAEALKELVNDCFTAGVTLDMSSTEAFEASFAGAIDAACFIRAWGYLTKTEKAKPVEEQKKRQDFVIKQKKDLRKASLDGASGKTSQAPF